MSDNKAPIALKSTELSTGQLMVATLPLALQIFFDNNLFTRCQTVANYMAEAEGMPKHIAGKPKTCFAILSRALTWRLDPYAVAVNTYTTPNGAIGYYGSLCQAILENSGRLMAGVKFEHYGDWSKLRGRFKIVESAKGGKYPVPTWAPDDEIGLGVKVSAQVKGEPEPRELEFDLVQAYPRNSTLWATDAKTQICYTAVRRFATSCAPSLFLGVPFDHENLADWADALKDVTPARPQLAEYAEPPAEPKRTRRRASASEGASPADQSTAVEGKPQDPGASSGDGSISTTDTPPTPSAAESGTGDPSPSNVSRETTTAEGADEKHFVFADELGEVHEFGTAREAIDDFAQRLDAAENKMNFLRLCGRMARRFSLL